MVDYIFCRPSVQPNKSAIKTGSEADKLEKGKKVSRNYFFTCFLNFYFQHPSRYLKCFTHEIGGFTTTFKIKVFNENWRRRSSLKVLSKVWVSRAKNLLCVWVFETVSHSLHLIAQHADYTRQCWNMKKMDLTLVLC